MTYCVGLLLEAGIVMLADTRTNAGMDNIATYRKLYLFEEPGERVIGIMTSGSLSVTQTALAKLQHEIERPDPSAGTSVMLAETMLDVAEIVGRTLLEVGVAVGDKMSKMNHSGRASLIVGGQRRGGRMRLFLIYPEGNFIEATEDTPYLQIGEHKYGKPILDRVVTPGTTLAEGRKVVLLSMDSTLRSNLSVGMPLDLAVIREGECRVHLSERIAAGDPAFTAMSEGWSKALRDGFANLR